MPSIDMIAVLRSTKSKRKFEQILYRGTRLHPLKKDFLVLDMGNNLAEHGPLGSPYIGGSKKEQAASKGKICPTCEDFAPPLAKECPTCLYQFPLVEEHKVNHSSRADETSSVVYTGAVESYEVKGVSYYAHKNNKNGNESIKVSYKCDFGKYGNVAEWISPWSASDWARSKALQFFRERGKDMMPPIEGYSMDDLLWHCEVLKKPLRITVDHSGEYPRITKYEWPAVPLQSVEDLLLDEIPY